MWSLLSRPQPQQRLGVRWLSILGELKPSPGSTHTFKRVGRGPSSGYGKTSGRGQKGQKARGKVKSWFEGGQTPIYKLFPKIGFTNVNARPMAELNLERIQWFHDCGRLNLAPGQLLDMKLMKQLQLVSGQIKHGVKILGKGAETFNVPLKIEASRASAKAVEAIERAGGEFTARYFSDFGIKVHLHPERFLKKTGRIPLQARPTKRKDIQYYTDISKRGYLIKEKPELYHQIVNAKNDSSDRNNLNRKNTRKSSLELELAKLSLSAAQKPQVSKIITAEEFNA